jgi:hypothetical protein
MTKARDLANAATALSAVTATELGYLDGVTSSIQTQMNTKAATTYVDTGLATKTTETYVNAAVAAADSTPTALMTMGA